MSLRVLSIDEAGEGYELTDRISGLRWTNVRNRGDESASFTFHAPWQGANPEVDEGNLLVIFDGLDVRWQGEIDEVDRSGGEAEALAITAYGLGQRLKADTYTQIFIDKDLSRWREPSVERQIDLRTANTPNQAGPSPLDDQTNGPGLQLAVSGAWDAPYIPTCEGWYDAGEDGEISEVQATWEGDSNTGFIFRCVGADDDAQASAEGTATDEYTAATGTLSRVFASVRRFVSLQWLFNATGAGIPGANFPIALRGLTLYGPHGLTKQGDSPGGFFASQIVAFLVGLVDGVSARRVDATAVVIGQAAHRQLTHEDGIADVTRFHTHERTWGTWAPDSPLEPLGVGQFDYTAIDGDTDHWTALRADCDDLSLQSERGGLANVCVVNYTDENGVARSVTRTRTVAELGDETQTKTVDAGTMTTAGAEAYGDAVLALYGGFAPARGSAELSGPVTHHYRGPLSPTAMRADGSNLRVPDVLPSTTLFELSADPDRRTTFPVQRVEVDASGEVPKASVELDQAHDVMAALAAQLEQATELVGA